MDDDLTGRADPQRKHLLSPARLAEGARRSKEPDLRRGPGQGNGLRVHGVYFALVSGAVLVAFIIVIAFAGAMM
ncbi:MAG: hypothetical protein F2667_14920 [Actinobacteria bacterium]|uniref:Unannotated protein n=1 Tax=freshwater metagenome TaxID=449393 RepID=A0A6J6SJU6_9ZZZZ|nr:hypothetical protein [Actinomycetota bacterium]